MLQADNIHNWKAASGSHSSIREKATVRLVELDVGTPYIVLFEFSSFSSTFLLQL